MDKVSSLQQLGFAWFALIKDQAKLVALESELAQVSIIPLLVSGLALTLFSISLWLILLVFLGYLGMVIGLGPFVSLLFVLAFNCLMIFTAYKSFKLYKKRIGFERTRASLKELI